MKYRTQKIALVYMVTALILFAVGLFFTVVPISANGDFIAAGC